jgi:filamentous hemagglutinin family protein
MRNYLLFIVCSIIIGNLIKINSSQAQIIPDATLNNSSTVTLEDTTFQIDGGTVEGTNLFHSFQEFSLPTLSTAFFNNSLDIKNIFTRVTGNLISNIDGTIKTQGTANLFLLNSQGIIFGENASLDMGGSFFATTASYIRFADGTEFPTKDTQQPLLTIAVPIGLGWLEMSQPIINRSLIGLQVPVGKSLGLLGGDISIEGGAILAFGGKIELGSVAANNFVNLIPNNDSWIFNYEGVENFHNLSLSQQAVLDTSGEPSGSIQIRAKNIKIIEDSGILSTNFGTDVGGDIVVVADEAIEMSGDATTISNSAQGFGDGGNIAIATKQLIIRDGAYIETPTEFEGKGGNLTIKSEEFVELIGTTADGLLPSGLFAEVRPDAIGMGGTILVETSRLILEDGAQISTTTLGIGKGGNILIQADESIDLIGERINIAPSGLFARVGSPDILAIGEGGNININTKELNILNGAQIASDTFGLGNAGNIVINNAKRVQLIGTTFDYFSASGLFSQVERLAIGNGGTITINTQELIVRDGAQIGSLARNIGKGGSININAEQFILLTGTSPLGDAKSSSGIFTSAEPALFPEITTANGGNLLINTPVLIVEKGAKISADTFALGNGGDIVLEIGQLIVNEGGLIGSGSLLGEEPVNVDRGKGGIITIEASDRVRVNGIGTIGETPVKSSIFTKTESKGNAGDIHIITPKLIVSNGGEITVSAIDETNINVLNFFIPEEGLSPSGIDINEGNAGNLSVNADVILLKDNANITGNTFRGSEGNIRLNSQSILLSNNSNITTNADENATGGNITIDTETLTSLFNSDITANANRGRGGKITITSQAIFRSPESDITAISQAGVEFNGTVTVNTPDVDPSKGLIVLPTNVVDLAARLTQTCKGVNEDNLSSFVVIGRGGLPSSPLDTLREENVFVEWITIPDRNVNLPENSPEFSNSHLGFPKIVEAEGWMKRPSGKIILLAQTSQISVDIFPSILVCDRLN